MCIGFNHHGMKIVVLKVDVGENCLIHRVMCDKNKSPLSVCNTFTETLKRNEIDNFKVHYMMSEYLYPDESEETVLFYSMDSIDGSHNCYNGRVLN